MNTENNKIFIVRIYPNSIECLTNINFNKNFNLINSGYYFVDKG